MIVARGADALASVEGPLALTVGVFDGCHLGHRAVFDVLRTQARAARAFALVATFDPHPLEILRPDDAPSLLTTASERLFLLERLGVDGVIVVPFDRETADLAAPDFLDSIVPARAHLEVLVVGFDFRMGKNRTFGFDELQALGRERGFRTVRTERTSNGGEPVSSTRIRALLREGRVRDAESLLGHRYLIEGEVVRGRGVGRSLDFPTANVDTKDARKLLPGSGVYATIVTIEDGASGPHPGVMNIGTRPTFGLTELVIEVHLPAFSGDLVGQRVRIELVDRIREERTFSGPEALKARIAEDVALARRILEGAV